MLLRELRKAAAHSSILPQSVSFCPSATTAQVSLVTCREHVTLCSCLMLMGPSLSPIPVLRLSSLLTLWTWQVIFFAQWGKCTHKQGSARHCEWLLSGLGGHVNKPSLSAGHHSTPLCWAIAWYPPDTLYWPATYLPSRPKELSRIALSQIHRCDFRSLMAWDAPLHVTGNWWVFSQVNGF